MKFSTASLRTRKGWCTRKGHDWGRYRKIKVFEIKFHKHVCQRCRFSEFKEPISHIRVHFDHDS